MSGNNAEARVTVWVSERLRNEIDDEYINWRYSSRSEWMREAAQTRMVVEDELAELGVDLPDEKADRDELIGDVIRAGVASIGEDLSPEDE